MVSIEPTPVCLPSDPLGDRWQLPCATASWRLAHLLAEPRRLAFAAGGALWAAGWLWWAACVLASALGVALPWAVTPATAQSLWFAFGATPLFAAGLLFSHGPRWLDVPPLAARALAAPVVTIVAGWVLAVAGFHVSVALAGTGLALAAAGFAFVAGRFALMLVDSRVAERGGARLALLVCALGSLLQWVAAVGVVLGGEPATHAARLGVSPVPALAVGAAGALLMMLVNRDQRGRVSRWDAVLFGVWYLGTVCAVVASLVPLASTGLSLLAAQCWGVAAVSWGLRLARSLGRD
jgi:hypothetical protein